LVPSVQWSSFTDVRVGSISQTLTYPLDVLRRKMQVVGMAQGGLGYKYNGALDALREIIRMEGVVGLYRGLWPNLRRWLFVPLMCPVLIGWLVCSVKVAPSIATSCVTPLN
jgi:Mitochondrial carrier protein